MTRTQTCSVLCVIAVAGSAAAACSRASARTTDRSQAEIPTVAAARVVRGDIAQVLTVTAEFRPFLNPRSGLTATASPTASSIGKSDTESE